MALTLECIRKSKTREMKYRPAIIGLSGKAGSGKDTFAELMMEAGLKSYGFRIMKFADILKQVCATILGVDRERFEDQDFKASKIPGVLWGDMTYRDFLIKLGTDALRNHFDEDIWVKALLSNIDYEKQDKIIVTDVRFKNEADAIRSLGGKILRLSLIHI